MSAAEMAEVLGVLKTINKSVSRIQRRLSSIENKHLTLRQDHLRVKADVRHMPDLLESYREQIAAVTEMVTTIADAQGVELNYTEQHEDSDDDTDHDIEMR
ncbi:hypothetical protein [uncultured Zhongshania sp.]|uniref:hypothetical protein n=1 Tax=uncultured Zhongshania sp. TaxID=1642288 RepID=UPI0030DDD3C0